MSSKDFNQNLIQVQDIMSKSLISVNPATTSFQVAKMMEQGGMGAIIVQENKIPTGIITDRDFAIKIAANNLPFDTPVKQAMSSPLIMINHDESILSAAEMMCNKKIRKLAVSKKGKIVGLITSTDLVNQLAK